MLSNDPTFTIADSSSVQMQRCRCYLYKHAGIKHVVLLDDPVRLGALELVKLQGPPNPLVGRRAGGRGRAFSSSLGVDRDGVNRDEGVDHEELIFLFPVPRMCPHSRAPRLLGHGE